MKTTNFLLMVAAVMYGLHNVFTKLAAGKVDDRMGGLILEGTAAILILLFLIYSGAFRETLIKDPARGIGFSALAGICVAVGTVLFFQIFRIGGELSLAGPFVLSGGVLLMAVIGLIMFKETVSVVRVLGILFSLAGIFLLSTGK